MTTQLIRKILLDKFKLFQTIFHGSLIKFGSIQIKVTGFSCSFKQYILREEALSVKFLQ